MSVASRLLEGGIAYIRLKQFQEHTHDELLRAAAKLRLEAKGPVAGVILDLFTAAVGHASVLAPGFAFVPRKQLIQESARRIESIGSSRLMDFPERNYTSGTTAMITVLRSTGESLKFPVDLP